MEDKNKKLEMDNLEAPNKENLKKNIISIIFLMILLVLIGVGYSVAKKYIGGQDVVENQTEEQQSNGIIKFDLVKTAFAKIENVFNTITPAIPYNQVNVSEIENLNSFPFQFTNEQQQALENNGFFLSYNNVIEDQSKLGDKDDFVDMYDEFAGNSSQYYRNPDDAIFITSDLSLHLYHLLIDRSFQKIEETKFQPMVQAMTKQLFLDSINKYNETDNETLKESYKRLSAYYLVPLVILDAGNNSAGINLQPENYETFAQYLDAVAIQKIESSEKDLSFSLNEKEYDGIELSDEIYQLAKAEVDLIQLATGVCDSPLISPLYPEFTNDYSQFKPRSHYTKNDILKSYFIAMMWYGRMGFVVKSPELTRDALIITRQINDLKIGDKELSQLWSDMSAVIDFFVGEVDDLTAFQYTDIINEVYGSNITDESFIDDNLLNECRKKIIEELPSAKIISEVLDVFDDGGKRNELLESTKQFRFMGQRFTPDAYVINNLTQGAGSPDPETGQMLPLMPTALMFINVIEPENQIVKDYLNEWINDPIRIADQDRQSDKIIDKKLQELKQEFAAYDQSVWTQNIYWSWLNCFKPLLAGYGEGYPSFMQTDNWLKKNLSAVLGSFTELKHDTLLYAKQSYAERGGGPENNPELPPVVKGYVEPDLTFWNRIVSLAEITKKGLEDRNILPSEFKGKYQSFIDISNFFKQIAEQELQNQKISDDDFEKLRTIKKSFNLIVSPLNGEELTTKEKRAGIIADIHTDGVKGQILYEATGKPFIIYVAVQDINGTRLTRGASFNHYEFTDSLDERLSDEDWQAKVYEGEGQLPENDKWAVELIK